MQAPRSADLSLLERAHANAFEFYRLLARHAPRGGTLETDGLAFHATGLPLRDFNPAWAWRLPRDPDAALARLTAFARELDAPWQLQAVGALAAALAPHAVRAGLTPAVATPGLLLAPLPSSEPPLPDGLTIAMVESERDMAAFNTAAARGFEIPPEAVAALAPPELFATPDLRCYVGFVAGEPVATAMRYTTHRIAGIETVSTAPEYRGRGLGAALTWRAVCDPTDDAPLAAYLQASPMGYPVYRRMGFRHVVDYIAWDG